MYPHPDILRVLAKDREITVRRQYRDAQDAKVARRARRKAR